MLVPPALAQQSGDTDDERPIHEIEAADSRACRLTSQVALTGCRNAATGDYWLTVGACANIADRQERQTCLDDAASSKKDALQTCSEQFDARQDVCRELGDGPYDPDLDPSQFSANITNTYLPFPRGEQLIYKSTDSDGTIQETDVIKVRGKTTINGFPCRAVTDKVYEGDGTNGKLIEDTIDWYSQDSAGNVWYFGETTIAYTYDEADNPTASTEGSWIAFQDNAKPGLLMPANPGGQLGKLYRQEFALGTAEDLGRVIETNVPVPGTNYKGAVHTQDSSALEPGVIEDKYYVPGVGLVLTVDPDGTREELISIQ
jgi:hypothetical protein